MRDAHCLKVSSHTQSTISLSSGESEYYGIVKCAAIGLGARSMLSDFGMCADVVVRTDSSSGLAVGSRRGLGRLRHVQTRYLWVQQRVQEGDLRLKKESGDTNVSDALTKTLDEKRMLNLLTMMGYEFREGRTSLAPEAQRQSILFSAISVSAVWRFQQQDFFFFEASGVAQWYSGARMMSKAQNDDSGKAV